MKARYQPVEDGYQIIGSGDLFNRTLYGGHAQDHLPERYITFAGDQPVIMGAVTDWRAREDCTHAKCGVLMAGLAKAPGDRNSQWLHWSDGIVSTFRNGWMEYDVRPPNASFPSVRCWLQVLPLEMHDGFLVHLRLQTNQHVHLVLAFGGITDFLGLFDQRMVPERLFRSADCAGTTVVPGHNRATVTGPRGVKVETEMRIGASFPVEVSVGNASHIEDGPGKFLARDSTGGEFPMARMSCPIMPGKTLDGFVVVMRNAPESALDEWLLRADPAEERKREIIRKRSTMCLNTPDRMLDLTVASAVLAMDACWHDRTFYHGAVEWHVPYMGWRHWYGPTVLGWNERVRQAIRTSISTQVNEPDGAEEKVTYEGGQYTTLRGSHGYIPEIPDGRRSILYNMQEVFVDHLLHYLEWTGDIDLASETFDAVSRVLDWEKRILDPDDDGLYQNWLNTWISDAHSYNGGGCAQSSAYNYRANRSFARLAEILGRDASTFARRAEQTSRACRSLLWQASAGVFAEYVDTVGRKLLHPSPELATIYHAIDADLVDRHQAHQMLRFTETSLVNERTEPRGGRLVWSSQWLPSNYSSCGLYTAENLHLAWAYFVCGYADKGMDLLSAVVDAHFMGRFPGAVGHCMTGSGFTFGSIDFSEIMSLHLRVIVEGLFGVRPNLLDGRIDVAPHFPSSWDRAELKLSDLSLGYRREGRAETFTFSCHRRATCVLRVPMRGTSVLQVRVNGSPQQFERRAEIGRCEVVVKVGDATTVELHVVHGPGDLPTLQYTPEVDKDEEIVIQASAARILSCEDPSACLDDARVEETAVRGRVRGPGAHTLFLRVRTSEWEAILPADVTVRTPKPAAVPAAVSSGASFRPLDISSFFNASLETLHQLEYRQPRPAGYSIVAMLNGRFGWDWNQGGFNTTTIDATRLRGAGGTFGTPSGIRFLTPGEGANLACASIWENFPDRLTIPLSGRGAELALFFIGVTNPMQSQIENGRFVVTYSDGSRAAVSLVPPRNFDDWLNGALQEENETVYFSDYNHGIVQRIALDPARELASLEIEGVANEAIVGLLGVSLR